MNTYCSFSTTNQIVWIVVLFIFVDARSLFDRGKSVLISSITYERLLLQLFLRVGSESNVWEIHSINVYLHDGIRNTSKLFVQLSERDIILLAVIVPIEVDYQSVVHMVEMWRAIHFLLQLQYGLSHEISVHSLVSLVVTQIHLLGSIL